MRATGTDEIPFDVAPDAKRRQAFDRRGLCECGMGGKKGRACDEQRNKSGLWTDLVATARHSRDRPGNPLDRYSRACIRSSLRHGRRGWCRRPAPLCHPVAPPHHSSAGEAESCGFGRRKKERLVGLAILVYAAEQKRDQLSGEMSQH